MDENKWFLISEKDVQDIAETLQELSDSDEIKFKFRQLAMGAWHTLDVGTYTTDAKPNNQDDDSYGVILLANKD